MIEKKQKEVKTPSTTDGAKAVDNVQPPLHGLVFDRGGYRYRFPSGVVNAYTAQEVKFVELYLRGYNSVDACIEAGYPVYYKNKDGKPTQKVNRNMAYVISSELLGHEKIYSLVNEKLQNYGWNDENVQKQHLFLINQHQDLTNKSKAVDMYYKLHGSYAPDKHVTVHADLSDILSRLQDTKKNVVE